MENVCCDPDLPLCFPALHLPFIGLLCGHQCRGFLIIPTLASDVSSCLFCIHLYPISHSIHTPSFFTANFSSEYNRALGSIVFKPIPPNPDQLHSETHHHLYLCSMLPSLSTSKLNEHTEQLLLQIHYRIVKGWRGLCRPS